MKRCPTCSARISGKSQCHRCGMDFTSLLNLEAAWQQHLREARHCFSQQDFEGMFFNARRACALRQTTQGWQTLAIAALATRRYDVGLGCWQRLKEVGSEE